VDQSPPACPGLQAHQGPTQLTASYRRRPPLACKQLGGELPGARSTAVTPTPWMEAAAPRRL
jgi:hypothetical protein